MPPSYVNIPTGSTRSYIQTALNGMTAGGTMHFEAGEYTIDTALSLLPNIRFVGDGMRASVFKLTAGSATPFEAVNLDHISFENLGFEYVGGTFSYIVRGTTTTGDHGNIGVKNCRFSNFNASGRFCVDFKDVNDCRVEGCQFENVWCGVSIRAGTKDVYRNTCFNCDFKNFEYAGVYATLVSPYCTFGTSVIGCRASKTNVVATGGLANPILFNGPRATPIVAWHMDVLIANNVIIGPGNAYEVGIVSTSDQFYLSNLNGGVVAGNISAQGGANGMLIWASKKVVICANQCDKNYANGMLGTGISNCAMTGILPSCPREVERAYQTPPQGLIELLAMRRRARRSLTKALTTLGAMVSTDLWLNILNLRCMTRKSRFPLQHQFHLLDIRWDMRYRRGRC